MNNKMTNRQANQYFDNIMYALLVVAIITIVQKIYIIQSVIKPIGLALEANCVENVDAIMGAMSSASTYMSLLYAMVVYVLITVLQTNAFFPLKK